MEEKRQDERFKKTLENELEWVRATPGGRQTKSRARLERYEELLHTTPREALTHSSTIYIPPGPRLGDVVIEARALTKSFGEKLLINNLDFSVPAGAIVVRVVFITVFLFVIIIIINTLFCFTMLGSNWTQWSRYFSHYFNLLHFTSLHI
jgi:hypothetical protein